MIFLEVNLNFDHKLARKPSWPRVLKPANKKGSKKLFLFQTLATLIKENYPRMSLIFLLANKWVR